MSCTCWFNTLAAYVTEKVLWYALWNADPFADAEAESESQNYIHVRVQQRNGRKSLTTVQVRDHLDKLVCLSLTHIDVGRREETSSLPSTLPMYPRICRCFPSWQAFFMLRVHVHGPNSLGGVSEGRTAGRTVAILISEF